MAPPAKTVSVKGFRSLIREFNNGRTRSLPTIRRWLLKGVHLDATNELVTLPSETCPTTGKREILYTDAVAFIKKVFGDKKAVVMNGAESGVAVSSA